MRNVKELHPELQIKLSLLQSECKKQGIVIGVGECLRTQAEQDALYAKGRTKPGKIVTKAKGNTYSSMHQWGVAVDIYLKMDVDGDGSTADDAFNNSTGLFNKVGKIGQSIGLEWGGSWKSIKDLPHFQLPQYGSTPAQLKAKYGSPNKFMKSSAWSASSGKKAAGNALKAQHNTDKSAKRIESAQSFEKKYAGSYDVGSNCNLMSGAGTGVVAPVKKGTQVQCYGYYTKKNGKVYLFVQVGKKAGFINKNDLK